MNPYRVVQGRLPSQKELSEWTEVRWSEFISFASSFIGTGRKGEMFVITKESVREAERCMEDAGHPWAEFMHRIDLPSDRHTPRQFYYKFQTMVRICLTYLKRHPSKVTAEMEEALRRHPARLGWCLGQYKAVETSDGGEVVQRDTMVQDGFKKVPASLPSMQAQVMTAMSKTVDLYNEIARSIKPSDVKAMPVKEKIAALQKLGVVFDFAKKSKVAGGSFTQINIAGSPRDMERAMLDFVKRKESDDR